MLVKGLMTAQPLLPARATEIVCWRRLFLGMSSVEIPRLSLSTIQREVSVVLRAAEDPAILTFKQIRVAVEKALGLREGCLHKDYKPAIREAVHSAMMPLDRCRDRGMAQCTYPSDPPCHIPVVQGGTSTLLCPLHADSGLDVQPEGRAEDREERLRRVGLVPPRRAHEGGGHVAAPAREEPVRKDKGKRKRQTPAGQGGASAGVSAAGRAAGAGGTSAGHAAGAGGCAARGTSAGVSAAGRAAGAGAGTGIETVVRLVKRRGTSKATPASIIAQKALLMQSYPGEPDLREDDDDLSPQLDMRQQRHEVMEANEVNELAYKVVMGHLEGMPHPRQNGSLSPAQAPWNTDKTSRLPLLQLGCPINRAARHAPRERGVWGEDQKERALREFYVSGTIVVFVPEVCCRRALSQHPQFRKRYQEKGGEWKSGVKLPCPECRSNENTGCGRAWNRQLRAVHTSDGRNWLVATRRYRCYNPGCPKVKQAVIDKMSTLRADFVMPRFGPEKRVVTDAERDCMKRGELSEIAPNVISTLLNGGWSFSIDDERYMDLLPPVARLAFPFDLFGRGGATHQLLDKTMVCGQSVAAMTRDLGQGYSHEQTQDLLKYAAFTQGEGGRWPAWKAIGEGTLLSPPTAANVETYSDAKYQQVKPFIEAEMCSRGAKVLAWDGTFASARQVDSEAKVLVSVLNELGHVLGYAAVTSKKWANVLPLFMGLRARFERLGMLEDLKLASSDTCCEGLLDPRQHVMPKVYPSMSRAPFADLSHKAKIATDAFFPASRLYAAACREIGAIFARPHTRDELRAANSLVESGMSATEAVIRAKSAWGKRYIRTMPSPTIVGDLEAFAKKYKALDDDEVKNGRKPLFRRRKGCIPSSLEAIANVGKCGANGCLDPGLSLKDTYTVDAVGPQTGLRTVHKLVGTGKCDSLHSGINRQVVSQAPKLGVERSDREMAYFFKKHNDSIDERRGLRRRGIFAGRSWTELQVKKLWTNIDGPNPGGNPHMPSQVAVGERPEEVGLWNGGKEVFGHEYLATYHEQYVRQCAKVAGIDVDGLEKNSILDNPADEDGGGDMSDGDGVGRKTSSASTPVATRVRSTAATPVGTPFAPTEHPSMSEEGGRVGASEGSGPQQPEVDRASNSRAGGAGVAGSTPNLPDQGSAGAGAGPAVDLYTHQKLQTSARAATPHPPVGGHRGRGLKQRRADVAMTVVIPETPDELRLARECTARAKAAHGDHETEGLNAAAVEYNTEVLRNLQEVKDGAVKTLKLRGTVTPTQLKKYWTTVLSKYAAVSLLAPPKGRVRGRSRGAGAGCGVEKGSGAGRGSGVTAGQGAGGGAGGENKGSGAEGGGANSPRPVGHASQGAQKTGGGGVFFMTDEAIDVLGSNALKRVLRSLDGGFCRNDVKAPALKDKLKDAVKQKMRLKK